MAKAFAKRGFIYNPAEANEETPEQINAVIKELFPKIPQSDLTQIVDHAWKKDAGRVGHARHLTLAQRAQLAVIARIRHSYTDYDALLHAFGDWKGVRKQVEPDTLKKIIEWRGECGDDDETLEEIVRETIVIDDDDDDAALDGSSDTGDVSDSSIQITHRPAAADDLRAEEAHERDHRFFRRHIPERTEAERNDIARNKIRCIRTQVHNAHAHAQNQLVAYQPPPAPTAQRIFVPTNSDAETPREIVVDGQVMYLVS